MDLALNQQMFFELSLEEALSIDGGWNWESIGAGLAIFSTVCIAIACAPASAFVGVAYVAMLIGSAAGGAAAGCYIGSGLSQ